MRVGHVVTLLQAINAFYATADHVLFYGSLGKQNYLTIQAFVLAIMGRNSEDINRFVRYKSTIMRKKVLIFSQNWESIVYLTILHCKKKKKVFLLFVSWFLEYTFTVCHGWSVNHLGSPEPWLSTPARHWIIITVHYRVTHRTALCVWSRYTHYQHSLRPANDEPRILNASLELLPRQLYSPSLQLSLYQFNKPSVCTYPLCEICMCHCTSQVI